MSEFSKAVAGIDLDACGRKLRERVSPSQVELWETCKRKWVFSYIFGLKTPSSPSQVDGTELHAECEYTSNSGGEVRDTKWKAVVQKALDAGLILIGDEIKNEQWVEIPTFPDGPTMRGKYDAVDWGLRPRDGGTVARLVNDYKSTKNFRWNKTPKELRGNTQVMTYGLAVLREHPTDTHVALRHTYLRTQGAAAVTKTEVVVPRENVIKRWQITTLERIKGMQHLVRELPREENAIASVEPTLTHCAAFGGCHFRSICGLGNTTFSFSEMPSASAEQEFSFEEEEKSMGLLEDMLNGVKNEEAIEKATSPKSDVCAACNGKRYVKNPAKDALVGSFVPCKACGGKAITPPDQPARDAGKAVQVSEEEAPVAEKKRGRPKKAEKAAPMGSIYIEEEDGSRREVVVDQEAKEAAATAREGALDDMEQEARRILNDPAPSSDGGPDDGEVRLAEKIVESTKKAKPSKEGVVIYVDCLPVKGAHAGEGIDYLEWLAPIAERVAASKKVADWRQISFSSEGDLAAEIFQTIKKSGLPSVILVSGSSRARAPFLEVAGMFATSVTMGLSR